MASELPEFRFADGRRFIPHTRTHPGTTPFDDMTQEDRRALVSALWHEAYDARRAEIERLKQNSLFYDGFHYVNAWMNRINAVTNKVYSLVEAQVSMAIGAVPRPEIVARGNLNEDQVESLQLFAEYVEDLDDYDHAVYLGARDKFIYGYNVWLVSFDYVTGMPVVKNISVFDWFPDPTGTDETNIAYAFIGTSVSTHRLRATYPGCVDDDGESLIHPDKIASAAYEVTAVPWRQYLENAASYSSPLTPDYALAVHAEGATVTQGVGLSIATGSSREHGQSTYLLQLMILDEAVVSVQYQGTLIHPDGLQEEAVHDNLEPRSPSGWWLLSFTAGGVELHDPVEIGEATLGLPIVVDRNHQRTDRYESMGEIDHVIPIQRRQNRADVLIARAEELQLNPPVIATAGHNMRADRGPVGGGEILTINRGSDLKFMEFRGPGQESYVARSARSADIESVSGIPDLSRGLRPAGIEAAAALRQLDDNAMRRMNAKENPAHRARARLLRKVMYAAGKKMGPEIVFKASDGTIRTVTSDLLQMDYVARYARGSGTVEGTRDMEEKALVDYQQGLIDGEEVLRVQRWPAYKAVAARVRQQKLQEIAAAAVRPPGVGSPAPGPGGNGGGAPVGAPVPALAAGL